MGGGCLSVSLSADAMLSAIAVRAFDQLVVEILCRLPPKALIRFKCVSKHWYSLITEVCVPRISPQPLSGICKIFVGYYGNTTSHYSPMPTPTPLDKEFVKDCPWENIPASLKCDFSPAAYEQCDVCNGLSLFFRPSINLYYLRNYTTQQFVLFPPPPAVPSFGFKHKRGKKHKRVEKMESEVYAIFSALAFDPKESPHFKVVRFDDKSPKLKPGVCTIKIFSSETCEWVEYVVEIGPPSIINAASLVNHCVYLNHALYRLSMSLHLVRYDLWENNVVVTTIKLPQFESWTAESTLGDCSVRKWSKMGVNNDLGCIGSSLERRLYYARNDAKKNVLIWILCDCDEYDAPYWVVTHSIDTLELVNSKLSIDCVPKDSLWSYQLSGVLKVNSLVREFVPQLRPVAFDPTSHAVILCALNITLWYHLDSKKLEVISHAWMWPNVDGVLPSAVFPFSRCLVPLKDLGWNHHRLDTGN